MTRESLGPALLLLALLASSGCSEQQQVPAAESKAPDPAVEVSVDPPASAVPDPEAVRRIRETLKRAGSLFQQTRFDEALEAASSAIEIAPGHAETYEVLSNWYGQLERHDLAIAAFERFAVRDPNGMRFMARHQALSGDHDAALQTLDRCILDAPRHGGCRFERSALRLPRGDFEGAIEDLRIAHEVAPDSRTSARYAESLRVTGSYDEALTVVEAALADDAESLELLLALAGMQIRNRQDDVAEATLRKVIELDPKSHRALRLLGGLVLRRGDEYEGRFFLSRADLFRDYEQTMRSLMGQLAATRDPTAALMIAELELTVAEYGRAQRWVDQARAGGAPAKRVAEAQAWIAYALGDVERGDAELVKLQNEDDGRVALVRAVRAFRTKDQAEATKWLRRAAEIGPNERSFLRRIADLHLALGDQASADAIQARAATAGFP